MKMSVKSLNEEFVVYEQELNLRDKTISEYLRAIENFEIWLKEYLKLSFILEQTIANVDQAIAQRYAFHLRKEKSNGGRELALASAKKEVLALKVFWDYMIFKGLTKDSPFRFIKLPQEKSTKEPVFMKVEDGFALVDSATNPIENLRLAILTHMGLRVGELVALEVDKFNFKTNRVTFLRKNQEWHSVGIPTAIQEDVLKHVTIAKANGQKYLFENKATGKHITTMAVTKNFKKASAKLGLDMFSPHALRKVCANNMKWNYGLETDFIKKALNHKSIATTDIYVSARESNVCEVMSNM
jgi:site-specific recombinase XerD